MIVFIIFSLVVIGLCLGSFVNALVWRLHRQEELREQLAGAEFKKTASRSKLRTEIAQNSIAHGRSKCIHCGHVLAIKDLVPVLSWLLLGGKCRYCKKPIEDTPLAELLTPFFFVVSYVAWPYEFTGEGIALFALWCLALVCFIALTIYDARWFLLPDRIVAPLVVIGLAFWAGHAYFFTEGWTTAILQLAGALVLLPGFFGLIYVLSREQWIGFGDVKLALPLALFVGTFFGSIVVLFTASVSGLVVALPQLLRGKMDMDSHIPFGPFLLLGTTIAVLAGPRLQSLLL